MGHLEDGGLNVSEQLMRTVAAVAGVCVLAYPFVEPAIRSMIASIPRAAAKDPVREKMRNVEVVLSLSSRLKEAGCTDGVSLCQKLIDVILKQ